MAASRSSKAAVDAVPINSSRTQTAVPAPGPISSEANTPE